MNEYSYHKWQTQRLQSYAYNEIFFFKFSSWKFNVNNWWYVIFNMNRTDRQMSSSNVDCRIETETETNISMRLRFIIIFRHSTLCSLWCVCVCVLPRTTFSKTHIYFTRKVKKKNTKKSWIKPIRVRSGQFLRFFFTDLICGETFRWKMFYFGSFNTATTSPPSFCCCCDSSVMIAMQMDEQ